MSLQTKFLADAHHGSGEDHSHKSKNNKVLETHSFGTLNTDVLFMYCSIRVYFHFIF